MYMSVDTGTISTIPAEPTRNSCISVKLIMLQKLRIGSYGDFEFAASGPVLTNSFWADGTTNITNIAEFKSLNRSDLRIEVFVPSSLPNEDQEI
jgi:hypothetical protein